MIDTASRPSAGQVRQWWKQYRTTGDPELRDRLMRTYLYVVYKVANALRSHLPDRVEVEELVSAGFVGLVQAFDGYDPSRAVKFQTYCAHRVRGAMFDFLRSTDWLPRAARQQMKELDGAREHLQNQWGRPPTDEELAAQMEITPRDVTMLRATSPIMGSLGSDCADVKADDDADCTLRLCEALSDPKAMAPDEFMERKDLRRHVTQDLGSTDRLVVLLYYYEGMTMQEIGQVLGVSESRVCQIHGRILRNLRSRFGVPARGRPETAVSLAPPRPPL